MNLEHLRLAIGLMGFLSVATFFMTQRVLKRASPLTLDLLAVVVIGLIGLYMYFVWGQLWIVNWIPLPSVIVLSNWFPILMAILAAVLWQRMSEHPLWRRIPAQLALIGVTAWSVISVIPATPPECGNEWIEPQPPIPYRVCRQTTPHTCSAAAVATILYALGIESSEAEMSRLCLTRRGTTWLGMYHGLSIKLMATGYQAKFFDGSVNDLPQMTSQYPVLLCCRLDQATAEAVPEYVQEDGWIPGVLHSVVCFGKLGDLFLIGDPSQVRLERWTQHDMQNLWTGTGLMITSGFSGDEKSAQTDSLHPRFYLPHAVQLLNAAAAETLTAGGG